jgi:hypothetical protein
MELRVRSKPGGKALDVAWSSRAEARTRLKPRAEPHRAENRQFALAPLEAQWKLSGRSPCL